MLSLAGTSEGEVIDGCPTVRITDSPADLLFFLKSLHDIEHVVYSVFPGTASHFSRFFLPPPATTTFAITAGILRLCTKYDIPFL
jgi:hypothetical protein